MKDESGHRALRKAVEIKGISMVFGPYQALKPVSFDIYDNEFFTLPARAAAMAMRHRASRRILNSAVVSDKLLSATSLPPSGGLGTADLRCIVFDILI